MDARQDENLIPISELEKILDIHRTTISQWVKDGTIPKPMVIRKKKKFWFWWQIREFVGKASSRISEESGDLAE